MIASKSDALAEVGRLTQENERLSAEVSNLKSDFEQLLAKVKDLEKCSTATGKIC